MSFLVPLMTVLATIAIVVLVIVGLVSVPWPILLLLLVAGLIAAQRAMASIPGAEGSPIPIGPTIDASGESSESGEPNEPDKPNQPRLNERTLKRVATALLGQNSEKTGIATAETQPMGATHLVGETHPVGEAQGKCLKYRGAVYSCPEKTAKPEHADVEITGTYRGASWTAHVRGKP